MAKVIWLLQADGFTAIKSWVIACIVFVFGAMLEYSGILLLLKLERMQTGPGAAVEYSQVSRNERRVWVKLRSGCFC